MRRSDAASGRAAVLGGPTVLTALVVLCFACLSVIALSRAQRDETLAVRAADTVFAYYEAEGRAEAVLSGFGALCAAPPAEAGEAMAAAARRAGADAAFDPALCRLVYTFDAGAEGDYVTAVRLTPAGAGTAWTVERALITPDDPAETDTTLPVYQ